MALLSLKHRKAIFKYLGLGEYNKTSIKAFQKKYLLRKSDVDGIYGENTDNALRTVYYTKKYTRNFRPEEFRCECHGKYCCGYPNFMKPSELIHIQAIRDHYGKPITVTCGLRCRVWNSHLGGSIQNSLHMQGQAIDFYQAGVTDNLANRRRSIKWIKKQPNHHYTYGNGINSYGNYVNAPYMGNALHTDTYNKVKATYPEYEESPSTGDVEPHKTTSEAEKKPVETVKKPTKTKTTKQKIVAWAKKIAKDNSWHYVHWKKNDPKTKECPVCHKHPKGKYHGTYCTIFPVMCWHHGGGIKVKCDKAPNNGQIDRIYNAKTDAAALRLARKLFGIKDIEVIRRKDGSIPQKKLKAADICYYYRGGHCQHAFLYIGDGEMIDANSLKDGIAIRKAMSCRVVIRYTGK